MSNVVALFSELDPIDEARSELERAGFGADVQSVIERSTGGAADAPAAAAAGASSDGTLLGFGHTTPAGGAGAFAGLGLDEEEVDFLRDAVDGGGRVLVVDTGRADDAERILRSHAQRVVRSD